MGDLDVSVERNGVPVHVGRLVRTGGGRARFRYSDVYLESEGAVPISVSLPLGRHTFDEERTKIFFEGLLPEGFTRRSVAAGLRVHENDYISILAALGNECLGALQIRDEEFPAPAPAYEPLSSNMVMELAGEGATEAASIVVKSHLSLAGASGKVGLYYDDAAKQWYLPTGTAPSTHIVKQSHVRLRNIVVNEQLALRTAHRLGIDVPESFIINLGDGSDGEVLFATRRYDRLIAPGSGTLGGLRCPHRLHQEDFAQILGIPSAEKYEKSGDGYLRRVFDVIRARSENPLQDMLKMWDYLIFDYLIGNTDDHVKNISMLYSEDLRRMKLAPLYDVLSTVVYDSSTRDMSLSVGGRFSIDEITRESFAEQAEEVHLGKRPAMAHFDRMRDRFEAALDDAARELKESGFVNAPPLRDAILKRRGRM